MEKEEITDLLKTLCGIPSPSNHEEKRAEFCRNFFFQCGACDVSVDDALNVRCLIKGVGGEDGKRPIIVFMAHTDTVFPDDEPMPYRVSDGKIYCPGVGDDTANLALLLLVARGILRDNLRPRDKDILIVCDAGEEGLGNLKGSRAIMRDYGNRVEEFYAVDGTVLMYCDSAVGSHRYEITVTTEGGHAYGSFGNRNAIYYMSSLITDLYQIKLDSDGLVTYNVGLISGGTSVNTIADTATCLYEYRSNEKADLAFLKNHLFALANAYRAKGIGVSLKLIGERPCSKKIGKKKFYKMMDREIQVLAYYFKGAYDDPEIFEYKHPGSTDCNIPLSMGIPAISFGCYLGAGAHTRTEWVAEESLLPGFYALNDIVRSYF